VVEGELHGRSNAVPYGGRHTTGRNHLAYVGEPDTRRAGAPSQADLPATEGELTRSKPLFLLQNSGVGLRNAAFFAMLGVSQCLPQEVFRSMLQAVAELPSGSEIVFNVVVTNDLMPEDEAKMTADFAARAAGFHEPWTHP
jgi:O-methyltransferase involved in polyketide biosynthesis